MGSASVAEVRPTELTSAAEVLLATDHDPFARMSMRRAGVRGWMIDGATAWVGVDAYEDVPYLSALGEPDAVGALVGELVPELAHRQRVTLPRGSGAHLPAWVGLDGTTWDFRWLPAPPPEQPGEHRVERLDDDAAVTALLTVASPRASVLPGSDKARRWFGVREAGALVACVADTTSTTGVGHLSSIAVDPSVRGHGWGAAVTASLARLLFADGADLVALGMYADNTAGRALYDHLGFRDEHRFTSGVLDVRSRW